VKIERLEKPIPLTERNLPPEVIRKVLQKFREAIKLKREKILKEQNK
jgi:hypothetical protein